MSILVPEKPAITTGAALNELIDRGYVFYANRVTAPERVKIVSFRQEIDDFVASAKVISQGELTIAAIQIASISLAA